VLLLNHHHDCHHHHHHCHHHIDHHWSVKVPHNHVHVSVLHLNLLNILLAWENSRCFAMSQLEPSQNDVWKTSTEIPYTDDVHYPDLGSASDWLKENSLAAQPIRSATKIWVVHVIGMECLHSLLRRRLARAQVATSRIVGCFLRLIFYSWFLAHCFILLDNITK